MQWEKDIWGAGPKLAVVGAAYLVAVTAINHFFFPSFRFVIIDYRVNLAVGLILMVAGVFVLVQTLRTLMDSFRNGGLCTEGIYSVVRHPLYSAWILILVPSIGIILGYIFTLSTALFLIPISRVWIKEEEKKLINEFGEEYKEYQQQVNAIIPTI